MASAIGHIFAKLSGFDSYFRNRDHKKDRDYKKEKAAFMAQLPDMVREGNQGKFTVFYKGKPLGYYRSIDEIDPDVLKKSFDRPGDAYSIFQVRKEYLEFGYGRTKDPKEHSFLSNPKNEGIESAL